MSELRYVGWFVLLALMVAVPLLGALWLFLRLARGGEAKGRDEKRPK